MVKTRIVSYNVNGIRAALNKGLLDWIKADGADVICLQELKANAEQFNTEDFEALGYHCTWHSAEKKGYSGVALLSKEKPANVKVGFGEPLYDSEGRIIQADFKDFSAISVYIPSGSSGEVRQAFKMKFLDFFYDYIHGVLAEHPNLVISGDYNICHEAIDIHDPVGNKKSSGFLPEERAWLSKFIDSGFVDPFRKLNGDKVKYSWWSYRSKARERNKGWRIDYTLVSKGMEENLKESDILNEAVHSDHCPVSLQLG